MAGVGIQPDLSDGPVVPGEAGDYPVGGPGMMALARYLPSGAPDDRRWIRDQERRRFIIPEDRDLKVGDEFPDQILITLKFAGFEPVEISRDLVSHFNQEQFPNPDQPPSIHVSYYFPLAPWTLDNENEAFYVKSHPLDHHHRNASGNRFAYDIFVRRWDGESWTELVEGGDDDANEDYLIWGRQVRSIGNGMVVECRRAYPDNAKPGEVDSSDANYLKIQYASSPFLVSDDEYVSFLHFQQGSIPEALCPLKCPVDNADCDVDTEGVIVHPVEVVLGQFLGLAGNSGHSSGAHLHIHLTTGAPNAGSYPLSFHDVIVAPDADTEGTPQLPAPESWHLVDERGIPHGVLLRPIL